MHLKKNIRKIGRAILDLFYPNLCLACNHNLKEHEDVICVPCQFLLPKTGFHKLEENPMTDRLWGRVSVMATGAYFYFSKGGSVRKLIHQLKYKDKPQIGSRLGERYGKQLLGNERFNAIDVIVPVPLHLKKQRSRGYNQSMQFAEGIGKAMDIPVKSALKRVKSGSSQTSKSRMDRFKLIENSFKVVDANAIQGKHVLLVDDVLTTGATIEACSLKILEIPETKISIATIAFAE